MSSDQSQVGYTQHAFLVVWGRFAQEIGLIQAIEAIKLTQKKYQHRPQTKVLEFLVGTLSGLKQLQDISLAAHPLDKDEVVAQAWEQPGWADYTGISRTLSSLSWGEVEQLVRALQQISQPFVAAEIQKLLAHKQRLCFDGDLTGLPVSNTSRTYPNATFGHMADEIRLGYQAALVSLESLTYGRLWLSVAHHPGDTVSCTQAEALVLAAEAQTGLRPQRRTALLGQRLQRLSEQLALVEQRARVQHQRVTELQAKLAAAQQQEQQTQRQLHYWEQQYQTRQRQERPTSRLAKARQQFQAAQQRRQRREQRLPQAQQRLAKTQRHLAEQQAQVSQLQARLVRFEQDNATNPHPIEAEFRLDAGFGTYDNVALLIEMGYDLFTKPYSHHLVTILKGYLSEQTQWSRVGANAEMVAWSNFQLKACPYPLNVALERFYIGKTRKHSALLHFGSAPVTHHLVAWFDRYNGRQLIEAGIKEGKQVFYLHRIKVRSEPAIYLQEAFVIFAANFIRWASHWLADQALVTENGLDVATLGLKKQVHVAAHVSAQVIWNSEGWLLRFSPQSVFAGKVLKLPGGSSSPPPELKNAFFMPLLIESQLIAQNLR